MGNQSHHGTLQPWQLFSGMFVMFSATSAYFDHFLMTFVFCIAFGVLGEVLTSYLYGQEAGAVVQSESFSQLINLTKQEKERIREQHLEKNMFGNGASSSRETVAYQQDDQEDEAEDDDGPPPVPAKDYRNQKDINFKESEEYFAKAFKDVTVGKESTEESLEISQLSTPPFENIEREDDQILKEESKKSTDQFLYKPSDFEDILAKKYSLPVDDLANQVDTKKIYAPDSSDDEELEEEYANREVDFDESESEEEEFIPMHSKTKISDSDSNSSKDEKEIVHTDEKVNLNELCNEEEIDIDLTDPQVEKAATKIQKVFKGFKVRKKIKEDLIR